MKNILVGLNSKFIHTSLALRYLKEYSGKMGQKCIIKEYTINNNYNEAVSDLYLQNGDVYGFSVYIFNLEITLDIIRDLKRVKPDAIIFCGGPEVSYDYDELLYENKDIDFIIRGEGEKSITEFLEKTQQYNKTAALKSYIYNNPINGVSFLYDDKIYKCPDREPICDLNEIPFPYDMEDLNKIKNRILYYESSRGCPFSCSYCLSSAAKGVRTFDLNRVFKDLKVFLDFKVRQIKFVDRTFNFDAKRALKIMQFIKVNDNGYTNFHFEIAAWLLNEETFDFLETVRTGLFQFEIGIQSTNPQTLVAINRKIDFSALKKAFIRLNGLNVKIHADLIAGLPYEGYESFAKSFDEAMALKPDVLQLGFLKVLKGTAISRQDEHQYIYSKKPPYEVLKNKYLSYDDIIRLKRVEAVLELYYNSSLCMNIILYYIEENILNKSAFCFYSELAEYLFDKDFFGVLHKTSELFDRLYDFMSTKITDMDEAESYLVYDLYSFGKLYERPYWLRTLPDKEGLKALFKNYELIYARLSKDEQNILDINEFKKSYRDMELVHFKFNKDIKTKLFLYGKLRKIIDLTDYIIK